MFIEKSLIVYEICYSNNQSIITEKLSICRIKIRRVHNEY